MAAYCPGNSGDLLVFKRPIGYLHYAVNVGAGYIVHVTSRGDVDSMDGAKASSGSCCSSLGGKAVVKKERYSDFKKPDDLEDNVTVEDVGHWNGKKALKTSDIVDRALSRVGKTGYNVLFNNCEHFARWCRYDEETSGQVINLAIWLVVLFLVFVPRHTKLQTKLVFLLLLVVYLSSDSEAEKKKKAKEQSQ